jgi:signal transduction histidine kinase
LNAYVAVFTKVSYAIIKEITPQILFSLALTTAITASFIVMYRSLRSQQRLNDMKNDFISNVTHELKTPVATVSVALEALKDFDVLDNPARSKEYLSIAQEELNRLTLMTDKILKAAVYENQGITFTTEKVNLVVVVGKVLSSLKVVFEKHNLQVRYLPEGSDFEIEGSTMHLTNVVYNLIDNAIKYGSDNSTIDVVLRDSNDKIELAVQDKGIGIATEYHKKIFEKFFRIPTGDVHDVKGYGLGLNYVFEVVKKHHGKIDVVSEPAKGSVFTVRLPKRVH